LITHLIKGSGNEVLFKEIIPDDQVLIGQAVKDCLERDVDVLIISGGTGITPGDVTIEAVRPLIEKELPGFGELLRRLSFEAIGSAAMLTRALAGVVKGKVVFCIPGSPHAAKIALENIILIEAPHVIAHARGLR
jgi:molybdenum cofactor biosynthesis protein B